MSKVKISPARAAILKAKAGSIASKLPATRNPNGSIKPRDKTGGKAARDAAAAASKGVVPQIPAIEGCTPLGIKPGNGHHAETLAQLAVSGQDGGKPAQPEQVELPAAQAIDVPLKFVVAALSIAPKNDTRMCLGGVYLHQLEDKALRIVATDGHRLFVAQVEQEQEISWLRQGVIVPRAQLERILKYIGKDAPGLRIEYGTGHPSLKIEEIGGMAVFQFAPVDGTYPDYQRVVDSAAPVFTAEREELSMTTIDSDYLKAAGALSAQLGSKGIIPFLTGQDSSVPSVFAFGNVPEALLYIASQRSRAEALPAPTVKLFGADAMQRTLADLEAQIVKTREGAQAAKHEKFRDQKNLKADRLQARADELRAALSTKLAAPAAAVAPPPAASKAAAAAVVH